MATTYKRAPRKRVRRLLGSLFREARRLERRRRLRYAAAVVLGCVIAGGGGFLIANDGGRPAKSGDHPLPPLVSSLALPQKGDYFALAVVGGRVLVSGGPRGSLFPSGSVTSLADGRVVGTCDAAVVAAGRLKLGRVTHANCGDPALYGEQVLAVSYLTAAARNNGLGEFAVRIAHVDSGARDGYTLGPVVMTYPQCSDCSVQWIYGDGSLWLYAAYSGGSSRSHGELLRVSGVTGKVAQRWAIPQNPRELLAVDADGLWFAPSVEGGYPSRTSASQRSSYQSLYRVTPGARAPVRVLTMKPGGAHWLVAARHTVWLETNAGVLWRVRGSNATPTRLGRYPDNGNQGADIGEAPPTHAGNAAIGVYFISSTAFDSAASAPQEIVRLSADAAKQQTVAREPAPPEGNSYGTAPPAVALGRSVYFLNPPLLDYLGGDQAPIVDGRGVLYRVTRRRPSRSRSGSARQHN